MTCVVGVVHEGKVWMGGDSAGADSGWSLSLRVQPKVFKRGPFLIGYTTSFRMGQLLQWTLATDPPEGDPFEFMCTGFIDAVRKSLKDGGFAKKSDEKEEGGSFLVGFAGRLFGVHSDYQVSEETCGYDAVGCGAEVARGAMSATPRWNPERRLSTALVAAERHSAGVRGPFTVLSDGPA